MPRVLQVSGRQFSPSYQISEYRSVPELFFHSNSFDVFADQEQSTEKKYFPSIECNQVGKEHVPKQSGYRNLKSDMDLQAPIPLSMMFTVVHGLCEEFHTIRRIESHIHFGKPCNAIESEAKNAPSVGLTR